MRELSHEEKLKSAVFFIEATSYEQLCLWRENHQQTNWEEDRCGVLHQIGNLGQGKPICVSFTFAKIYGKRICFYEATSRYVDHEMVEEYLEKNYPVGWDNGTRRAMTDAMNFHLAIDACSEV